MTNLLSFHIELANAWKLFLQRWGSAAFLQALTLIPGILMFPLVSEYLLAIQNGIDTTIVFERSVYGGQFLVGFILLILLGVFITASTGILFAAKKNLSLWVVIKSTLAQYIPTLYTSIVAALAIIVSLLPAFALNYGYASFARNGATITGNGILAVDTIMLIAIVALLIPAAIVTIWVMYAPLATATKASPAGFTSLMFSKHLVYRHVWQILWRIIGSMALFQILSTSVSTLPYLSYLVPFILSIIIMAFFVEIYKELHGDQA